LANYIGEKVAGCGTTSMDTKPPKNDKSSPTASAAAAAVTVMDKYIRLQQQQDDRSRPDTQYKVRESILHQSFCFVC